MIFYHIDRTCQLLNQSKIDLTPFVTENLYGSVFNNLSVHGNLYFRDLNFLNISRDIELTLEYVRVCKYQSMPSRFQSIFASRTIEESAFWIKFFANNVPFGLITIDTDNYQIFDCSWITPQPGMVSDIQTRCKPYSLGAMCDIADAYWSKKVSNKPIMEVLIPLPCKIVKTEYFHNQDEFNAIYSL